MKYRTPTVRRRQQTAVGIALLLVISATAAVSANAIRVNAENQAQLKYMLEHPVTETAISEEKDGLWVAGDSVILGIKYELQSRYRISVFNARVGRQASELLTELKKDKNLAGDVQSVVDLGNNNRLREEQVVAILDELKQQPLVIVVNTAVPRGWKDENNSIIDRVAARYSNVRVIDWDAISSGHPEYFAPDGVHLSPLGATVYVDAIINELKKA